MQLLGDIKTGGGVLTQMLAFIGKNKQTAFKY